MRKSLKISILVIVFIGVLLVGLLIVMLGAQIAFLVKLPRLSQLIHDGRSMWLVFSTFPDLRFGLFVSMAYCIHPLIDGLSRKTFTVATFRERIKNVDRRHVVVAVGIAIFALPWVLAAGPEALSGVAFAMLCIVIGRLIIRWTGRFGVPWIVTGGINLLYLGFVGTLLMPGLSDQQFPCTRGFVELVSGERMPCETVTAFSDKPIWLIENADSARLIPRRDMQLKSAMEAQRPLPAIDGSDTE